MMTDISSTARLEPGYVLVDTVLPCINAQFIVSEFTQADDNRGSASFFERFNEPAVFVEVIHTLPNMVRGNHVHEYCDETMNIISGKIELFLLCNCPEKHVLKRVMRSGETVVSRAGVPHALYALKKTEIAVLFSQDPRSDRERVQILTF